jgi:RNA polymerase sigma-70 factor (ECF subfamily)
MAEPTDPALSELLARMHWVRGLAGALVRDADRADDLAQDAWVRALRAGPAQAGSWRGWFSRVMKNRVADEGRLQGQHARFEARHPRTAGGPSEQEILQQVETHAALSEALRALPDPYRRAVFLHYFEGWSLSRIAAEDECDKRAIEKRLRQARAMMRTHLERRAPAEHWSAGLLLLAPAPQTAAALAIAAALLAVALIVPAAWLLQPEPAADVPGIEFAAVLEALPAMAPPPESPEPVPAQLEMPALTRTEVADSAVAAQSAPFDLIFVIQDAETKAGIPNVRVTADCRDEAQRVLQSNQGLTDAQGRLALRFTAASTEAWVSIMPSGWSYESVPGGEFGWGAYREVIEFPTTLQPHRGGMRGTVRDDSGAPVPGAFVDLWLDSDELNSPRPGHTIQADSEGNFALIPARPECASLFVAPRAAGMHATQCFEMDRRPYGNSIVEGVDLILSPGRPLSVEVIDERRQPVEGAAVAIWPGYGTEKFESRPDGMFKGRHHFRRLTDSSGKAGPVMIGNEGWVIAVSHPAFAKSATTRVATEGESMLIMLENGRSLRGRLLDESGLPVPNADVIAEAAAGSETVRSDAQGAFLVRAPGLAGEEVRLLVIPQGKLFSFHVEGPFVPENFTAPLSITLARGQPLNVDLVYSDGQPYDRMDGMKWDVITGPMARAPGGDAGTAQSWLKLRPVEDNGWFKSAGFTDSHFHFSQCPPGSYLMRFSNAEGVLAEAEFLPGVKGQQVVLPGVSTARGVVQGLVVRAGSLVPLTRFDVFGRRYAGPGLDEPTVSWRLGETVQDSEGRFRFEKLVTGWWDFNIEATRDLTSWRSGRIWVEAEIAPWTVVLDEVIAGELTILYANGSPAARCKVSFADERGELMLFARTPDAGTWMEDQTDGVGRVRIAKLPRSTPFQIWVTPQNRPKLVIPAGALAPGQTAWTVRLPE